MTSSMSIAGRFGLMPSCCFEQFLLFCQVVELIRGNEHEGCHSVWWKRNAVLSVYRILSQSNDADLGYADHRAFDADLRGSGIQRLHSCGRSPQGDSRGL